MRPIVYRHTNGEAPSPDHSLEPVATCAPLTNHLVAAIVPLLSFAVPERLTDSASTPLVSATVWSFPTIATDGDEFLLWALDAPDKVMSRNQHKIEAMLSIALYQA